MALGDDESNPDQDEEWTNLHEQLREAIEQAEDQESWQEIGNGSLLAVFEVCEAGSADDLAELLNEHEQLDLNMPGPDGDTALHIACLYGHMGCVKLLFEKGAEATVLNEEDGSTTLHDAAAGGYLDICKLILEKGGAELVKIADEDGDTPLHNAARGNHTDVVALLLASGADPKALNKEGNTPAQEAEEEAVIQLLEKAASP